MTAPRAGAGQGAGGRFQSGFTAVVGRPNVGKSTLVNALVGVKVAIVAGTPQTTRNRIAGVVTGEDYQLVLLDLPGFQKPRDRLTERMQAAVDSTLEEVDLILLVLSAAESTGPGDRFVARAAFASGTPVIIALNKADLVAREALLPMIEAAAGLGACEEIFPISALRREGLEDLRDAMVERMPAGPMYYPPGTVSDQPERMLAGELVREQAVRLTHEELPHAIAVEVLDLQPRRGRGIVDMRAVIIVERESQKGIIIGKQGKMIREIGTRARRGIEALLGSQVFLELSVKVRKKWRDDERMLEKLGL